MNDLISAPPPNFEERYVLAMESINEGIYDFNAVDGSIYYAPQLSTMLGLRADQLCTPEDWMRRIHPDDLPSYRDAWRALYTATDARLVCEYRYRAGNGCWRWARQHGVAEGTQLG